MELLTRQNFMTSFPMIIDFNASFTVTLDILEMDYRHWEMLIKLDQLSLILINVKCSKFQSRLTKNVQIIVLIY